MKEAIETLRNAFGDSIHIMAGNVATLDGFNDLADWGADSVRCNIGGGSICSTRIQTGHGMPTLQSVLECAQSDRDVMLIADGIAIFFTPLAHWASGVFFEKRLSPRSPRQIALAGQKKALKYHTIFNRCQLIDEAIQARL